MDLGVVLPCLAEDIDNLSAWIFEIVFPFRDPHHSFISGLAAFKLCLRDKNICSQIFGICQKITEVLVDFQSPDERLLLFLNYFYDLCFRLGTSSMSCDIDFHSIAIQSMHRIAFSHENSLAIRISNYRIFSITTTDKHTNSFIATLWRFVFTRRNLYDFAVECHFNQLQSYVALLNCGFSPYSMGNLLIIICVVLLLHNKVHHLLREGNVAF
ncbi:hypothetical protein IMSAGC021_00266 [Muribaculaceae bacterium]|nr:hypothetical protein IMSAGC021_00266 [Muribaculaceae bacterium]